MDPLSVSPKANAPGRLYAQILLDTYQKAPETPQKIADRDRDDARWLYDRGVPLSWALAAIQYAILYRFTRSPGDLPLEPIGSLRYFFPVIEKLAKDLQRPDSIGYLDYLDSAYERQRKRLNTPRNGNRDDGSAQAPSSSS